MDISRVSPFDKFILGHYMKPHFVSTVLEYMNPLVDLSISIFQNEIYIYLFLYIYNFLKELPKVLMQVYEIDLFSPFLLFFVDPFN